MKLYELPIEAAEIEEALSENLGELTPELEERINAFMCEGKDKVEAAAAVVRSLEGDAEICKQEASRLKARSDGLNAAAEKLKGMILVAVDGTFGGKIKTARWTIWGQSSAKILNIELLPGADLYKIAATEPWCMRTHDPELDKLAIRQARVEGKPLPEGIEVKELPGTRFLRIK